VARRQQPRRQQRTQEKTAFGGQKISESHLAGIYEVEKAVPVPSARYRIK
jgi:hypothetical protein